jgi:hypothetical protein
MPSPGPAGLAPVRGRALDGTEYRLPAGLPAERTLVVLAFRQRQQADVDRWIDLAVSLGVPGSPLGGPEPRATAVVEVPVLGRRHLPARRFIAGGTAAAIRDAAVLARTITVYTDPATYRRRCGIAGADQVTAMLVDREGHASFQALGPPTAGEPDALATALGPI